ncbi:MAG: DUF3533 domain-containing protein [Candidatus Saccharibacteria bacterium]
MSSKSQHGTTSSEMRASNLLRNPKTWITPTVITTIVIALMTLIYFGAIVNPVSHLRSLPVTVVNEDAGSSSPSGPINIGDQVVSALKSQKSITTRLNIRIVTLSQAEQRLDKGSDYAAVVIPSDLTKSVLALYSSSTNTSEQLSTPSIEILTNQRSGSLGVSLANGVLQPALNKISEKIGQKLLSSPASESLTNPVYRDIAGNPISISQTTYRPLPNNAGLGLSAFYIALLTMMCGFLGATLINSSVDAALGYSATEVGTKWRQKIPIKMSRLQTLLTKWLMALPIVTVLVSVMLLVAIPILKMDAPHFGDLWLLTVFSAIVVAMGTLALFAALGSLGQIAAMLIFVYLGLASSGGTVPLQALGGFYRFIANFEPLRQILGGVRSILYFNASGAAGLERAFVMAGIGFVIWLVIGLYVTTMYDRKGLDRMNPELMDYIQKAVYSRSKNKTKA